MYLSHFPPLGLSASIDTAIILIFLQKNAHQGHKSDSEQAKKE